MKKDTKFTTTQLLALGGLAVLKFLVTLIFYTTTLTSTGSLFSGYAAVAVGPFFTVLSVLVVGKFGSALIFNVVRTVLELPLPMIFPPFTNIVLQPLIGIITDVIYRGIREKKILFSFLGGCIYNLFWMITGLGLFLTVGLSISVPPSLITIQWIVLIGLSAVILGGLSGILALFVYKKVKDTSIVVRIQRG